MVRLLGTEDVSATPAGVAGWKLAGSSRGTQAGDIPTTATGMTYGLYLFSTGGIDPRSGIQPGLVGHNAKVTKANMTGSLAAIWYMESAGIILSGNLAQLSNTPAECAALQGSTVGATFTIAVTHEANTIDAGDRITITTSKGSVIHLDANANTPTAGAVGSLTGNQTINFDLQGLANAGSTNEHIAASIADVLKKHAEVHSATSTAGGVVSVVLSNEGSTTVTAVNAVGDGMAPSAVTQQGHSFVNAEVTGSHVLIESSDTSKFEFVAYLYDAAPDTEPLVTARNEKRDGISLGKKVVFNFDRDSDKYIRKVFNTNPTLMNSTTTAAENVEKYFLGETFDRYVKDVHGRNSSGPPETHKGILGTPSASPVVAAILPIGEVGTNLVDDRTLANQDSVTNWVISQDTTTNATAYAPQRMKKLFKFIGIADGGWNTSNIICVRKMNKVFINKLFN